MVVALLLAVQALLLVHASRASFVTADEPGHFAAGIVHWRYGAFDLYRVDPPLARMLAVLPVLPLGVIEDTSHWHPDVPGTRGERQVGQDFAVANGAHYLELIRIARLVTIAWTLLGGLLVFAWSRELWGERAGLVGLAVWCFEPNVLAHGCLLTPDMPATVAAVLATWLLWRLLERPSWRRTLATGALLGVALAMKLTNLLLLAVWPVLALVARRRAMAAGRAAIRIRELAAIAGVALVVVNLAYGCSRTFRPLGSLAFTSETFAGGVPLAAAGATAEATGNRFHDSWLGRVPVPLPADYVQGLDVEHRDFERHFRSYLDGAWRRGGWWYYYLLALAYKVPTGTLLLALAGIALAVRDRQARSLGMACVWLPAAAVLVAVSSQTGFDAHLRYVLPIFPALAIFAGRVACERGRIAAVAVASGLGWSALSTARVYPDTLAHFTELAGGAAHGDAHLLDSNLDWGQDALALRAWLAREAPGAPLGLAYFGGADPQILGLRYTLPPRGRPELRFARTAELDAIGPHPGLFAVSVNFLRGLAFEAPDGRGGWQPIAKDDFTYFQRLAPIASAGWSIRIFCLDLATANAARADLALPALPVQPAPVDCAALARTR